MKIFGHIIRTKSSLKKQIGDALKKGVPDSRMHVVHQLIGVYNAAVFGICIYRTAHNWIGLGSFRD